MPNSYLLSPILHQLPAGFSHKRTVDQPDKVHIWHYSGAEDIRTLAAKYSQTDWALLPDNWQPRLLLSDLDGTLTPLENIDFIAEQVGVGAQVAEITSAAMRGELDYADSFRARMSLLQGVGVANISAWADAAPLRNGALELFSQLTKLGLSTAIVSGGLQPTVASFARRLSAGAYFANEVEAIDGLLTGTITAPVLDAAVKQKILLKLCVDLAISPQQAIAVGDGANDLLMLQSSGLAVGVDPKPVLVPELDVCLRHCGLHSLLALIDEQADSTT